MSMMNINTTIPKTLHVSHPPITQNQENKKQTFNFLRCIRNIACTLKSIFSFRKDKQFQQASFQMHLVNFNKEGCHYSLQLAPVTSICGIKKIHLIMKNFETNDLRPTTDTAPNLTVFHDLISRNTFGVETLSEIRKKLPTLNIHLKIKGNEAALITSKPEQKKYLIIDGSDSWISSSRESES
ncbi:hypothetical protein CUN67_24845 (plasmid) [Pantoea cypripedii]|uniref:Uncharacterized protein n=2 Tax=Pantoea cypripedii TaxID=55209 RepID=A0A6B9G8R6_PANCY|nr:hypothetical protein CUN67_24845 [Pantoea cypripedii]